MSWYDVMPSNDWRLTRNNSRVGRPTRLNIIWFECNINKPKVHWNPNPPVIKLWRLALSRNQLVSMELWETIDLWGINALEKSYEHTQSCSTNRNSDFFQEKIIQKRRDYKRRGARGDPSPTRKVGSAVRSPWETRISPLKSWCTSNMTKLPNLVHNSKLIHWSLNLICS